MLLLIQSHSAMILAVLLSVSEIMAFLFPNASGIVKAISLLKGAGAKDVLGK